MCVCACVCVCALCVQSYYVQRYTRDTSWRGTFTLIEHVRVMGVMSTVGVQVLQLERPVRVEFADYLVINATHTHQAHMKHTQTHMNARTCLCHLAHVQLRWFTSMFLYIYMFM